MNADSAVEERTSKGSGRVDAVDCARGLALIGMAAYHLSWDLADFHLAKKFEQLPPCVDDLLALKVGICVFDSGVKVGR